MDTRSSPDMMHRKPVGNSPSPSPSESANLLLTGEAKENLGRKPLPGPPGSTSRAPMSPVRINVQTGDWPRVSNVVVEGDEGGVRQVSGQENNSRFENNDSGMLRTHNLPLRPNYTVQESPHQQPHMAAIVSSEHLDSRSSLNGSSPHQYTPEEELPEELEPPPVAPLQYHHQATLSESSIQRNLMQSPHTPYSMHNERADIGQAINRHLSPNSQTARRTPQIQRPMSAYSDSGQNRRSPYAHSHSPSWSGRAPSAQSGRSDGRPLSFLDLNNVSYPQMPPAPISFDNSQLRGIVGSHASLLSTQKTLEMYRQNIKKLNDPETQYAFAVFLVSASAEAADQEQNTPQRKVSPRPGSQELDGSNVPSTTAQELLNEAKHLLQKLSDRSYPFAQYYLGDGYASGLFSKNKEEDNSSAFPLFVSASKHGHAEAGYRAALCYEFGWGCRKDPAKAVQFLRHSASKNHPGAMTRLGRACLSGDLGENKYREGVKWLKRGSESADAQYNAAPFYLGQLYEKGCGDDIFQDEAYAAQLYTQAADLGHGEAAYRMGDAYEHGKLLCPRDPALSVHFYTCAAQTGHAGAMMALCAWYMIGAEPVLEKDEDEAYEWAREAALKGLTKAEYAVGYFTEMGIGTRRDPLEANVWYVKAAAAGDDRARIRIAAINAAASGGTPRPMDVTPPRNLSKVKRSGSGNEKVLQSEKDKECIVM